VQAFKSLTRDADVEKLHVGGCILPEQDRRSGHHGGIIVEIVCLLHRGRILAVGDVEAVEIGNHSVEDVGRRRLAIEFLDDQAAHLVLERF
jgi:hypothetical protein